MQSPKKQQNTSLPIMNEKNDSIHLKEALNDHDKMHIIELFHDQIEPRLMRMQARIGSINCEFAGEQYKNWVIEFRSMRSGFEIVGFEFDEDSRSIDLAPKSSIPHLDIHV